MIFTLAGSAGAPAEEKKYPPEGFVYVHETAPEVALEMRYYSGHNFMGSRVDGYQAPVALLTRPAAEAVKRASDEGLSQGYRLKVFDAYRPQRAVAHFVAWLQDQSDQRHKAEFYPHVDKSRILAEGYLAARSGHSRGSTVDLTLVDLATGEEVDMGSAFDFFDPISHHGGGRIGARPAARREFLKALMEKHGFRSAPDEWWHYTLRDEPYPDRYFDFVVR